MNDEKIQPFYGLIALAVFGLFIWGIVLAVDHYREDSGSTSEPERCPYTDALGDYTGVMCGTLSASELTIRKGAAVLKVHKPDYDKNVYKTYKARITGYSRNSRTLFLDTGGRIRIVSYSSVMVTAPGSSIATRFDR